MDILRLYVRVSLRHILSESSVDGGDDLDGDREEADARASRKQETSECIQAQDRVQSEIEVISKKDKVKEPRNFRKFGSYGVELLDFSGPKLMRGLKNWFLTYKIFGVINWESQPLYFSILYKCIVFAIMGYLLVFHVVLAFYDLDIISGAFNNPIFIFICLLSFSGISMQIMLAFKVNLFDLYPMYKILTTPKLCFLTEGTLHMIGTRSLRFTILMALYQSMLVLLACKRSLNHFVEDFYLPTFLLDIYANLVLHFNLLGMTYIDLYIRTAFGHWLLALQSYLELHFTHSRRNRRKSAAQVALKALRNGGELSPDSLLTFDIIRKSLNNMDDHLEVMRSTQMGDVFLMSLNGFLGDGAAFLLAYHLLADRLNFYHGLLFLLMSVNYIYVIFLSYFGDSWIYYALTSFTQAVEDEYFMQSDIVELPVEELKVAADYPLSGPSCGSQYCLSSGKASEQSPADNSDLYMKQEQLLLIKKDDVNFCREFRDQLETHLATPWSKMTLTSHLHSLRANVSLIAAQIIFDHHEE